MKLWTWTKYSLVGAVLTIITFPSVFSSERKFTTTINPQCEDLYPKNCSTFTNMTLLHIKSDGKDDTFHFLWSFEGAPTLLMARTKLNSTLKINWLKMFKDDPSISFEPKPFYSFGWSLVKVWVADDVNDNVQLDKIKQVVGYPSNRFIWERLDNISYANATDVRYTIIARSYKGWDNDTVRNLGPSGYFKFTIRMKSSEAYGDVLPYMLYSENSTQVDIAFNDVQLNLTEKEYPAHPRIGFKYIIVNDESITNSTEKMRIERTKTLDDEHTPGVFEEFSVRTPILNKTDQSFIQWKPICYTGEIRDVIDSVDVWSYDLRNASSAIGDDNVQDSILYSYYGAGIDDLLLEAMNISFGTPQDGYYNKTKHISWTYSTGFGEPPKDFVSIAVLIVISIGLGLPLIIICLSIFYVLVKKLRQPRDDLLLGR